RDFFPGSRRAVVAPRDPDRKSRRATVAPRDFLPEFRRAVTALRDPTTADARGLSAPWSVKAREERGRTRSSWGQTAKESPLGDSSCWETRDSSIASEAERAWTAAFVTAHDDPSVVLAPPGDRSVGRGLRLRQDIARG